MRIICRSGFPAERDYMTVLASDRDKLHAWVCQVAPYGRNLTYGFECVIFGCAVQMPPDLSDCSVGDINAKDTDV